MTYNFDPDRWYENERLAIDEKLRSGKLNAREFDEAMEELERRYDEMVERLDGTYQIPNQDLDTP